MTTGRDHWRSLQSVMVATIHVAVVAYAIRTFLRPADSPASYFVWVPLTVAVAVFLSWPIARGLARAFDPAENPGDPRCPSCGLRALRPIVRPGRGLFPDPSGYWCAACGTTSRKVGETLVEQPTPPRDRPLDPSGIEFLGEDAADGEIRFLDG